MFTHMFLVPQVRAKRTEFVQQVRNCTNQDKTIVCTYPITINTEAVTEKGATVRATYRYLVTNYYSGGNASPVFRNLFRDPELGFLPWVGTAMRIDVRESPDMYQLGRTTGGSFASCRCPVSSTRQPVLPCHVQRLLCAQRAE